MRRNVTFLLNNSVFNLFLFSSRFNLAFIQLRFANITVVLQYFVVNLEVLNSTILEVLLYLQIT